MTAEPGVEARGEAGVAGEPGDVEVGVRTGAGLPPRQEVEAQAGVGRSQGVGEFPVGDRSAAGDVVGVMPQSLRGREQGDPTPVVGCVAGVAVVVGVQRPRLVAAEQGADVRHDADERGVGIEQWSPDAPDPQHHRLDAAALQGVRGECFDGLLEREDQVRQLRCGQRKLLAPGGLGPADVHPEAAGDGEAADTPGGRRKPPPDEPPIQRLLRRSGRSRRPADTAARRTYEGAGANSTNLAARQRVRERENRDPTTTQDVP